MSEIQAVQKEARESWFSWIWLAYLGVALFIVLMLSVSPYTTAYVNFFLAQWYWVPFVIFFGAWAIHTITGISIIPLGHHDPDTYPGQAILGYKGALIASLLCALALGAFFSFDVITTRQVYVPVSPVFITGVSQHQIIGDWTFAFFSGQNSVAQGLANSIPAQVLEDTIMIFLGALIWLFLRYPIGRGLLQLDDKWANILGLIAFVIAYPIMFGFMIHVFAYGAVEVAYWRAFTFAIFCAIPIAIFGFPLPVMFSHLGNNFFATTMAVIGYGILIPPLIVITNKKYRKMLLTYLSESRLRFNSYIDGFRGIKT